MFLQSLLQEQQLSELRAQTMPLQREREELLRNKTGQVLTGGSPVASCCHVSCMLLPLFNSVELCTLFCICRMYNRSLQCSKGQMSHLPQLSIHNTTTTEHQPYSQQMVKHSPSMGCDHIPRSQATT